MFLIKCSWHTRSWSLWNVCITFFLKNYFQLHNRNCNDSKITHVPHRSVGASCVWIVCLYIILSCIKCNIQSLKDDTVTELCKFIKGFLTFDKHHLSLGRGSESTTMRFLHFVDSVAVRGIRVWQTYLVSTWICFNTKSPFTSWILCMNTNTIRSVLCHTYFSQP